MYTIQKTMYLMLLMLVCLPAYSTILVRNTFEEYQGLTLEQMGWIKSDGGNGLVRLWVEDTSSYQTQSHGEWSIHIKDSDNSSYASAYKTLSNSASEYMVEFYLWIYHSHATIDSFPLCVLYDSASGLKTDISLYLTTQTPPPPADDVYEIYIRDSSGMYYDITTIDSVDRWYKVQIYRHDGVVDLYVDGDSIATYSPMNSGYVSNKIVLGTTAADSMADGEVFYDDLIVVDYGDVKKQITAMKNTNQQEMLAFLSEANAYFSRIQPYLIYRDYHYFTPGDIYYVIGLSNILNATFKNMSKYERFSYFNEMVVKLDQLKLGLLYGNLNEVEKNILKRMLDFVVDGGRIPNCNVVIIGGKNE